LSLHWIFILDLKHIIAEITWGLYHDCRVALKITQVMLPFVFLEHHVRNA
jgi:hypothetical protein